MTKTTKNICITAMGVALFVVLALCLQVPVFENYYLCLGYVAMMVFCYYFGAASGISVGVLGVILYCLLTNGLRGLPGWAAGNLVIGLTVGLTCRFAKKLQSKTLRACGRDFIARKGEKNRHHFAHQSNYECVYANEIAVYMLVKQMLVKSNTILLPAVSLEIGSRVEQVKEQRTAYVGDVFYHCDPEQYPPLLIVDIDGRRTRVVLQFGKYFTDEDYRMLRGEAKRKDWDCLAVSLPSIIGENSLDIRTIRETVFEGVREKKWIHTNMAESWKVRFMEAAKTPPLAQNAPAGKMYECPIHRVRYNGRPIVRPVDCSKCPYSLAVYPECKCLAFEGIQSVKDFDLAREQRREIIDRVRRENDERYELAVQERERKEKLRSFVSMNRQFAQQTPRPQPARTVMTYEERVRVGKQQVIGKFDRDDNELVYDSFNLRWLKCRFCGEIKPEGEMATYGGREGAKMGTCRDCSRK